MTTPKQKTFKAQFKNWAPPTPVKYYPFTIMVNGFEIHLALHRSLDKSKEWDVSEPLSGARVSRVEGSYKGVPCQTKNFTVQEALAGANDTLKALIERVGNQKFLEVVAGSV